jgi:uncharacterized membrane protein (DUF4010 family)
MAYRTAAEVPAYDDDEPKPVLKAQESALFRMFLLTAFIAGPAATLAASVALAQLPTPPPFVSFVSWSLIAYVVGGMCMVDSKATRDWNWRLKTLGFTWAPVFLVGWLSYIALKWVAGGDKEDNT